MNIVIIEGRLTRDPEFRANNTTNVAKFTVAVDRDRQAKEGEPDADFIQCAAFGKLAEFVDKWFVKGKGIAVQGRISTGSYTNKDGNTVRTTEVICDRIHFPVSSPKTEAKQGDDTQMPLPGFERITDDDIPF